MKNVNMKAAWMNKDKDTIIEIEFNTENGFSMVGNVHVLQSIARDDIMENNIDLLQEGIENYKDELLDQSIREFAEQLTDESLDNPADLNYNQDFAEPIIEDGVLFGFYEDFGGQCQSELCDFDDRPEVQRLTLLWAAYQLENNVSERFINEVVELLNSLNDKDIEKHAKEALEKYVENY